MPAQHSCRQCGAEFATVPSAPGRYCSKQCFFASKLIPIEDRFWTKVDKTGECWEWRGKKRKGRGLSYGLICRGGVNGYFLYAHRVAWELTYGTIPAGMVVRHTCDNPACVRPEHLRLGTQLDNIEDAKQRKRVPSGDAHWTRRRMAERA